MPREKKQKVKSTDIPDPERVLPLRNLIDAGSVRRKVMVIMGPVNIGVPMQDLVDYWIRPEDFPKPIGKFKEAALWDEQTVINYLSKKRQK